MIAPLPNTHVPALIAGGPLGGLGSLGGIAALTRPPISPDNAMANAINANMGPPPRAPSEARAQAAVQLSQKWTGQITYLAKALGLDLGGSLQFAQPDERRVLSMLQRGAPPKPLDRATDRLVGDWMANGPQIFQQLKHGVYQGAESSLGQIAAKLVSGGVTSPQLQQAFQGADALLKRMDAAGIPNGVMDAGQLQQAITNILSTIAQAGVADARQHPEHAPLLQYAHRLAEATLYKMAQGLVMTQQGARALATDFDRLGGWTPLPPAPPQGPHLDLAP
jgi:hypothetical protein